MRGICELTNIARPGMALQHADSSRCDCLGSVEFIIVFTDKEINKRLDGVGSVTKGAV